MRASSWECLGEWRSGDARAGSGRRERRGRPWGRRLVLVCEARLGGGLFGSSARSRGQAWGEGRGRAPAPRGEGRGERSRDKCALGGEGGRDRPALGPRRLCGTRRLEAAFS